MVVKGQPSCFRLSHTTKKDLWMFRTQAVAIGFTYATRDELKKNQHSHQHRFPFVNPHRRCYPLKTTSCLGPIMLDYIAGILHRTQLRRTESHLNRPSTLFLPRKLDIRLHELKEPVQLSMMSIGISILTYLSISQCFLQVACFRYSFCQMSVGCGRDL
jgi:hypothetical protein